MADIKSLDTPQQHRKLHKAEIYHKIDLNLAAK